MRTITNILTSGELDEASVGFFDKSSGGRKLNIYNLDMILPVGYCVNFKHVAKPIDANEIQDIMASVLLVHREKNI